MLVIPAFSYARANGVRFRGLLLSSGCFDRNAPKACCKIKVYGINRVKHPLLKIPAWLQVVGYIVCNAIFQRMERFIIADLA